MQQGLSTYVTNVWGTSHTDVFAVGGAGGIFHYDGTSWRPQASGTSEQLTWVWGTTGSDVDAGGSAGRLTSSVILHYNGSGWTNALSNLVTWGGWSASKNDVFAVGDRGTIIHYNGVKWELQASGTSSWLGGVWGSSGKNVFAVGAGGTILLGTR